MSYCVFYLSKHPLHFYPTGLKIDMPWSITAGAPVIDHRKSCTVLVQLHGLYIVHNTTLKNHDDIEHISSFLSRHNSIPWVKHWFKHDLCMTSIIRSFELLPSSKQIEVHRQLRCRCLQMVMVKSFLILRLPQGEGKEERVCSLVMLKMKALRNIVDDEPLQEYFHTPSYAQTMLSICEIRTRFIEHSAHGK